VRIRSAVGIATKVSRTAVWTEACVKCIIVRGKVEGGDGGVDGRHTQPRHSGQAVHGSRDGLRADVPLDRGECSGASATSVSASQNPTHPPVLAMMAFHSTWAEDPDRAGDRGVSKSVGMKRSEILSLLPLHTAAAARPKTPAQHRCPLLSVTEAMAVEFGEGNRI